MEKLKLFMKKNREFIKKENLLVILISIVFGILGSSYIINDKIDMSCILHFNKCLALLISLFSYYLMGHFIFSIKKYYDFIYAKRFIIAFIILLIIVAGKFNGSSYGMWNYTIQPGYSVDSLNPIEGVPREIRSDEWLSVSSYTQSQIENNFDYINEYYNEGGDAMIAGAVPIKNILVLSKPFVIGYLILGRDYGASFLWSSRLILLLLVSFEFIMLLTKGNKVSSLIGMFLITFSPAVFWWYSTPIIDLLVFGQLCVLFFYHFLKEKKMSKKILYSVLLAESLLAYGFTIYPAWMVPFAYFYGGLGIYYLIKHIKENKFKIKEYVPLLISIIIPICVVAYFYIKSKTAITAMMSTVYPGARLVTGGYGYHSLFYYFASIMYPYVDIFNPCEFSVFYSLFPMILGYLLIYFISNLKTKEDKSLEIFISIILLIFFLFTFIGLPTILAKVSLLYMVPVERLNVVSSYVMCVLFAILVGKLKNIKISFKIIIALVMVLITVLTFNYSTKIIPENYINGNGLYFITLIPAVVLIILFTFSDNKYIKVLLALFVAIVSLISTIRINPIMIGFSGIYDKPVAKVLSNNYRDKKLRWIGIGDIYISDYLSANGIISLNATNVYPNLELWNKIDEDKKNESIYNRYAHIAMTIQNEYKETEFKLIQNDLIQININHDDLCSIDVNYIASSYSLDNLKEKNNYQLEYSDGGIYIYKNNCK